MLETSTAIELRHLRYFLAVYDELHFGHAADRLHMAQPPLSQAIRKLEQELGVELFVRTSRVVEATPAGKALADEARRVLASFEFAVTEARRVGHGDSVLRIGCVSFLSTGRIQRFVAALKKRDESLRAEVMRLWSLEQVDRLHAGLLDLGVLVDTEEHPELDYEPLFPGDAIRAFVPRERDLAKKPALTPHDLASETFVTYPRAVNPAMYDRYMRMFAEAGFSFAGMHEIDARDPRDALLAVADGLGIAFGPSSLGELGEESRLVVGRPLEPSLHLPDTIVAWRKSASRRLRSFLPAIRETARELRLEALAQEG